MLMMSLVAFNKHFVLSCAWHQMKLSIQLTSNVYISGSVQYAQNKLYFVKTDSIFRYTFRHITLQVCVNDFCFVSKVDAWDKITKCWTHFVECIQRGSLEGNAISLCGCHSDAKSALNVTMHARKNRMKNRVKSKCTRL